MFEIVDYKPEYQKVFEKLNLEWLEKYFQVEPIDRKVLGDPDKYIISPGGSILFVRYKNELIGCVALKWIDSQDIELTKMAVDSRFQGLGAGKYICENGKAKARQMGCKRVILYSNRKLMTALHIYNELGFKEIDLEKGIYNRADIKMELEF